MSKLDASTAVDPPPPFRYMANAQAARMGYSPDRRKRRAQHRAAARLLRGQGGGSTMRAVAAWHLMQARRP